jgi:malic enzyme
MGIPIGKISLYVAAGGFFPARTLPIMFDVGTNNPQVSSTNLTNIKNLIDPLYLGLQRKRPVDKEYYEAMDEFLMAVKDRWPKCLLQFEDFSNDHCFELLDRYRDKLLCFNDDIQG